MATATITIDGYLSGDAELRFTKSGIPVLGFTIPVTPQRFNRDSNQWEDIGETAWYRHTLWGPLAELFAAGLVKGTHVKVTGALTVKSFEAKDGTTRQNFEVRVDQIGVIEKRDQNNQQSGHSNGFGQQTQSSGFGQASGQSSAGWGTPTQGGHPDDPPF